MSAAVCILCAAGDRRHLHGYQVGGRVVVRRAVPRILWGRVVAAVGLLAVILAAVVAGGIADTAGNDAGAREAAYICQHSGGAWGCWR